MVQGLPTEIVGDYEYVRLRGRTIVLEPMPEELKSVAKERDQAVKRRVILED
jgi:hypothetical protein